MDPNNTLKTAFTTGYAAYYYVWMSFGLKNTGATFQSLMNDVLAYQIGRNLEAYINDPIFGSMTFDKHLTDL